MMLDPSSFATAEAIVNTPGVIVWNLETEMTRLVSQSMLSPGLILTLLGARP